MLAAGLLIAVVGLVAAAGDMAAHHHEPLLAAGIGVWVLLEGAAWVAASANAAITTHLIRLKDGMWRFVKQASMAHAGMSLLYCAVDLVKAASVDIAGLSQANWTRAWMSLVWVWCCTAVCALPVGVAGSCLLAQALGAAFPRSSAQAVVGYFKQTLQPVGSTYPYPLQDLSRDCIELSCCSCERTWPGAICMLEPAHPQTMLCRHPLPSFAWWVACCALLCVSDETHPTTPHQAASAYQFTVCHRLCLVPLQVSFVATAWKKLVWASLLYGSIRWQLGIGLQTATAGMKLHAAIMSGLPVSRAIYSIPKLILDHCAEMKMLKTYSLPEVLILAAAVSSNTASMAAGRLFQGYADRRCLLLSAHIMITTGILLSQTWSDLSVFQANWWRLAPFLATVPVVTCMQWVLQASLGQLAAGCFLFLQALYVWLLCFVDLLQVTLWASDKSLVESLDSFVFGLLLFGAAVWLLARASCSGQRL